MALPKVLVVEDDANVRYVTATALRLSGFEVGESGSGIAAFESLVGVHSDWDLVVLDVTLPDGDGFDICRRLRAEGVDTPVIFLTARDAAEDRLRGLTIGGDDYLTKPFSVEELIARARIILRRMGKVERSPELSAGGIALDDDAHTVRLAGELIPVSPTEYKLLRFLLQNQGLALTRAQILDHVWDYGFTGEPSVVESFVSSLRRKLDPEAVLLHTVRGVGYRMGG